MSTLRLLTVFPVGHYPYLILQFQCLNFTEYIFSTLPIQTIVV